MILGFIEVLLGELSKMYLIIFVHSECHAKLN